jgi:hypothetical protein
MKAMCARSFPFYLVEFSKVLGRMTVKPPVRGHYSCSQSPPSLIGRTWTTLSGRPRERPEPSPPPAEERCGWNLVTSPPTGGVQGECQEAMQCYPPRPRAVPAGSSPASGWGRCGSRRGDIALDYVMASSAKMVCKSIVGWPCASAMTRRAGGVRR